MNNTHSRKNSTPVTVAALSTVQLMVTALDGGLPRAMRAVLTEVRVELAVGPWPACVLLAWCSVFVLSCPFCPLVWVFFAVPYAQYAAAAAAKLCGYLMCLRVS